MWSDNDTSRDFLNFQCVAETAAELIVQAAAASQENESTGDPISSDKARRWQREVLGAHLGQTREGLGLEPP